MYNQHMIIFRNEDSDYFFPDYMDIKFDEREQLINNINNVKEKYSQEISDTIYKECFSRISTDFCFTDQNTRDFFRLYSSGEIELETVYNKLRFIDPKSKIKFIKELRKYAKNYGHSYSGLTPKKCNNFQLWLYYEMLGIKASDFFTLFKKPLYLTLGNNPYIKLDYIKDIEKIKHDLLKKSSEEIDELFGDDFTEEEKHEIIEESYWFDGSGYLSNAHKIMQYNSKNANNITCTSKRNLNELFNQVVEEPEKQLLRDKINKIIDSGADFKIHGRDLNHILKLVNNITFQHYRQYMNLIKDYFDSIKDPVTALV